MEVQNNNHSQGNEFEEMKDIYNKDEEEKTILVNLATPQFNISQITTSQQQSNHSYGANCTAIFPNASINQLSSFQKAEKESGIGDSGSLITLKNLGQLINTKKHQGELYSKTLVIHETTQRKDVVERIQSQSRNPPQSFFKTRFQTHQFNEGHQNASSIGGMNDFRKVVTSQEGSSLVGFDIEKKQSSHSNRNYVLLVDDNDYNTKILRLFLERLPQLSNVTILTAFNGLEAFNKFAEVSKTKSKVALVLIDCEMPIMDGIESTQKMREFERQHRLQPAFIVGLSGNWGHEFERKCKLNGMDQTYTKPLPMDTLSGIVNQVFGQ